MFSRLDSLFISTTRHAESADTRMGIKRDEERDQGRRQDKEREKDERPAWEDTTVVSVTALMAFLDSLITEQTPKNSEPAASTAPPVNAPPQAAAAAKAYQSTAGAKTQPPPPPPSGNKPVLTPDESAIIVRLLQDLRILADKGIESLTILRSESFLQSLVDAAARARQGL